ncbi:MAG TPA: fibronectin type III domain-containing protein [Patescibacteria group bacterium]|nr:fibronectin type III domain-containing protein [Patescibacteria group bacterium]
MAFAFSSQNFVIDDVSFGDAPVLITGETAPPVITSGPTVTQKGLTAEIKWTTDRSANSIVAFGPTNAYGTEIGQFDDNTSAHTVVLKNLEALATYHFQVRSRDLFGNTVRSNDLAFTTGPQPTIANVSITDITLSSAILTWTTSTITTSVVKYGQTLNYDKTLEDKSSGLTTVHTVRLKNLETGTVYHLQVRGEDEGGNDLFSDDYVFSTLQNPSVLGLAVTDITENSAVVSWKTNTETDSFVEYSEPGLEKKTFGEAGAIREHKIKIEELKEQKTYEYRVVGKDTHGNQVTSAVGLFTTPPDVTPPEISRIRTESKVSGNGEGQDVQVLISWNTTESSTSQVEYSAGVGKESFDLQTNLDSELATNHLVVLTKIRTAAAYTFRVKSQDAAGNVGVSQRFVVLMPQRQQGVLELIFGALQDAFSWLRNVGPYLFEVVTFKT